MARPVVLGNGELHVGINKFGLVHDFYYPYVGLENHAAGKFLRHMVGVWVDGRISWLDDGSWKLEFSYPHHSLIGHIIARHDELGIMLEFDDTVDAEFSAFMRNVHVVNLVDRQRDIRLFMHQAFVIGDARSNTDTAQYLPDDNAILHYRGRRAFVVGAQSEHGAPFDQFAVGIFAIEGHDGTYRDAEDGELSGSPVEHGRVDSTIRFKFDLPPHSSTRVRYWISCGTSTREALYIHKQVIKQGLHRRMDVTSKWWHEWLASARVAADKIAPEYQESFLQSVMLLKSHIDKRGAVIASTDSGILNYWRDAYGYCWPRDGAYVLWPLIRMGYKDEPYRFFEFCRRALNAGGYLMHKYRADGALGSSWHPYLHEDGVVAPPIQTDETALVLFVFSQFYHLHGDHVLLKEFYEPMIVPMADFLSSYIDDRSGLPKASYDLWEEQFLTTTYTTAVTYAALMAAADLAELRKDQDSAVKWRSAADDIHAAAKQRLFNTDRQAFYKGIHMSKDGNISEDSVIDMSSLYGAFMYGLFPVDSEETVKAVDTVEHLMMSKSAPPGYPRYENDTYRRSDEQSLGNVWFVTSLWMAQYYLETNRHEEAKKIIDWARDSMWPTGVLSEQVDPVSGEEISVAPLAWSQAEYLSTLLDTIIEDQ